MYLKAIEGRYDRAVAIRDRASVLAATILACMALVWGEQVVADDWRTAHGRAVAFYESGKYQEALPLLERAAEIAKTVERKRPEVAKSYFLLAHAHWKMGLMYVALPSKRGGELELNAQGSTPGIIVGGLVAVGETTRRAGGTVEFGKYTKRENLEQVVKLCRRAAAVIAQVAKEASARALRYECAIAGDRVAIFDPRMEYYLKRAIAVWGTASAKYTQELAEARNDMIRLYRAIGRSVEADVMEGTSRQRK